jgi:hypothetical protein
MTTTGTSSQIRDQLEAVAAQLASPTVTGPKRMALLRRQAELGDLRDALLDRARRRALAANGS